MSSELKEKEALLDQYITENKTDDAVRLLYDMAIDHAEHQRFDEAEECRDRLYEVDSMALSVIIKVNEAIENAKRKSINPNQRQLWAHIFKGLTPEATTSLYMALKIKRFEPDHTVIAQGKTNDRLYFVNSGRLKMICRCEEKDLLVKNMGTGAIFGQDTFFSINVCTHSVITLSHVELGYLDKAKLLSLQTEFPRLLSDLEERCHLDKTEYDCLYLKGLERRAYRRYKLSANIVSHVLTSDPNETLSTFINGELWDISKNGLSFCFRTKFEHAVVRLLGRTMGVRFTLKYGDKKQPLSLTGVVHGIRNYDHDDYSVHIKLNRNFSDSAMKTISKIAISSFR